MDDRAADPLGVLVGYLAGVIAKDAFLPGDLPEDAKADFVQASARLLAIGSANHLKRRNVLDGAVADILAKAPAYADTAMLRAAESDAADMSNRLGIAARIEMYDELAEVIDLMRDGDTSALSAWASKYADAFASERGGSDHGS